MTGILAGLVLGLSLGGVAARLWGLRRMPTESSDPVAHEMSDQDRDQLTAEFQTHATAVHRQVGKFADALAGDDPVLRARLRQFERGGDKS